MGQKVSPVGFRTGVTIGWKSRWFAPKSNYGEFLVEDEHIRRYVDQRLNQQPPYAAISGVEIERTREEVKVVLRTARPGLVIGPKGAEVDKLKDALEDLTNRHVNINIIEIKNPDVDAQLVAQGIAEQLKRRASFRRAMKQRCEATMQAGAKGVKIMVSGRLGGAEMSRSQTEIMGSIPLQTLEADVDYGFVTARTNYGSIGVKVWVYRGMFGDKSTEDQEEDAARAAAMTRARRRRERTPSVGGSGTSPRGGGRRPRREGPSAPSVRPGGSRLGALKKAPESKVEQPPAEDQPDAESGEAQAEPQVEQNDRTQGDQQ
jgi:small subunit ribosomal protein S3